MNRASIPRLLLGALLCAALGAALSCDDGASAPQGNIFENGGFEEGEAPWFSLEAEIWGAPFTVSAERAHSGGNSALLQLRSDDESPVRVFGVVTELSPEGFPEQVSGYYYVDRWEKGTPRQYLQFVAIVFNAENSPIELINHQVRYILAGVDRQPTFIQNARYVFVSTEEPPMGQWVRFELPLAEDFRRLWGDVPRGFDNIRFLFEVRYDDRLETDAPSAADVYFDDLYAGPAGGDVTPQSRRRE